MSVPFYTVQSAADRARLEHQNGVFPKRHLFVRDKNIPSMCSVCFETLGSNKPWHLDIAGPLQDPMQRLLADRALETN